ncbi:MAG TPA: flagellin, partial [Fervidobacterium sp.]|nr:flagellin [Fervidobacterium sp.]
RPEADVKVVTGGNFDLKAIQNGSLKGLELVNEEIEISLGSEKAVALPNFNNASVTVKLESNTEIKVSFKENEFTISFAAIGNNSSNVVRTGTKGDLEFEFVLSDISAAMGASSIEAQIQGIKVSIAKEDKFEFNDVKEGSYVAEVGQFVGSGTSPLDVRINHFNEEGLKDQLIFDFENGIGAIADFKLSSNLTVSMGDESKGIIFTWDTSVYDINSFNGALPMEEVVDSGVVRAEEKWYKDTSLIFQIGANEGHNIVLGIDDMSAKALGLTTSSLKATDQDSAERSIMVVDAAIHKVSTARASLGAVQNRLEHTISNLGVASENLTAAESRIRDADMAKEIMEFTKQQILMQSANAMLAQSNMIPQNVLQLLR